MITIELLQEVAEELRKGKGGVARRDAIKAHLQNEYSIERIAELKFFFPQSELNHFANFLYSLI